LYQREEYEMEENQNSIKEKKGNKKIIFISLLLIMVVVIVVVIMSLSAGYRDLTAQEIINAMDLPEQFIGYEVRTEINSVIPAKSVVRFRDSRIEPSRHMEYNAGTIIVFNSEIEAQMYKEMAESITRAHDEAITEYQFGRRRVEEIRPVNYIVLNKSSVLLLNYEFSARERQEYTDAFNAVIDRTTFTQENAPTPSEIEDIKREVEEDIERRIAIVIEALENGLQTMAEEIEYAISIVNETLDREELEDIELAISDFADGAFFAEMRSVWEEQLVDVRNRIEERERQVAEEEQERQQAEEARRQAIASRTLSQTNAIRSAQDYIRIMTFSHSGLIRQLEFEGFSNADATYAVNNITVDWYEQAYRSGNDYLSIMSFSRSGLIRQLEFEGFTRSQATQAVDRIGL